MFQHREQIIQKYKNADCTIKASLSELYERAQR